MWRTVVAMTTRGAPKGTTLPAVSVTMRQKPLLLQSRQAVPLPPPCSFKVRRTAAPGGLQIETQSSKSDGSLQTPQVPESRDS